MNVTMLNDESDDGQTSCQAESKKVENKIVNRNSLDDDDSDSDACDDPFSEDVEDDVISAEFEAFSDTDTEVASSLLSL